ncbi:MAG: cupin domain-containing protein [Pseudomonadota bacterium]
MTVPQSISLTKKLSAFQDHWHPRIVAGYNGNDVRVAKIAGAFPWHRHADTDELFLVLKGEMVPEMKAKDGAPVERSLGTGDLCVVPKGVEHRPVAENECEILLMDRAGEPTTGAATNDYTKRDLERI